MRRKTITRAMLVACLVLQTLLGVCPDCPCKTFASASRSSQAFDNPLPGQVQAPRGICCQARTAVQQRPTAFRAHLPAVVCGLLTADVAPLGEFSRFRFDGPVPNTPTRPDLFALQILRQ